MGAYSPLFTFAVEHGFYENGVAHELSFIATDRTARVMQNTGLLVKPTTGGIVVLFDSQDCESLQLYASDEKQAFNLVFKVYVKSVDFIRRTDVSLETNDAILLFNNNNQHIVDGLIKLHDHEYVSMIDLKALNATILTDTLGEKVGQLSPLFVLNFHITEKDLNGINKNANMVLKNYHIKFKERQVFWKYYLLGSSLAGKNLFLVDVDNTIEFIFSGKEGLDNGREAMTFRTTQRLSLKEHSRYRFQLIEKENGKEKIIIKRLPVAKDAHLGQAIIDGSSEIVSEIYINC